MIKPLLKNIVVAVNGSDSSIDAAKYAILMSKNWHCKLHVIYVVDVATIKFLAMNKFFIPEESAEYEENLKENGIRYLSYVSDLAREKGLKIQTELRSGAVWSEIVSYAEEIEAEMILLGGSSAKTCTGAALSKDACDVLSHSRCSVMVVREPLIAQYFKMA